MNHLLWYEKPATQWMEGLPIGNGRLAGMVLGGIEERIALNHEWLWLGCNKDRKNEDRSEYLEEVRSLLYQGKYDEASVLANVAFGGNGGISGRPTREDSYQPAGDFYFHLGHEEVSNYRRELDLDKARVKVSYEVEGVTYTRRVLAHLIEDYIIVHIEASNQDISGEFWLSRRTDERCNVQYEVGPATISLDGEFLGGSKFCVKVDMVATGGKVTTINQNRLKVEHASEILIFINIGTDAKGEPPIVECRKTKIPSSSFNKLYKEHRIEHKEHYGRLRLEIDGMVINKPTNERIQEYRIGNEDTTLPILYFNYGRYLLCASSARGELPANLQGKWNEDLMPAWDCDYHNDINLQMNYWLSESGHLQEYNDALFTYLERMVPHGKEASKLLFASNGIWLPLSSDAWGLCTPETYGWSVFVGVAAWFTQHFWWHYEYGQDIEFLRSRAYPFLVEVANFYESFLVKDKDFVYQILPSQSPENRFAGGGDMPVTICISSTCDVLLVKEVLEHCIQAARILEVDQQRILVWEEIIEHLPRIKIGSKGQLLEWNEEFTEVEPSHRHTSHLIGLYPGDVIDEYRTPELYYAARKSLELRLEAGGGHTGWSRAWTACLYARMKDGERAFEHLKQLICDFATESLLDLHPPRIFQIDGNFGGTAAILEMLLQSYHEELEFLPALYKGWESGQVTGLRARGGYTIDLVWSNSILSSARIICVKDRECTIRYDKNDFKLLDSWGKKVEYKVEQGLVKFNMVKDKLYFFNITQSKSREWKGDSYEI